MSGVFFLSCFGMGLMTLIPAWSVNILNGDVTTNGALMSARGGGAMIAALMIASMGQKKIKGQLWTLGSLILPLSLLVFSQLRLLPLSIASIVLYGWCHMMVLNTSNAIIQTHIEDQYRGRVMSVYSLLVFGAMPIGSLWAGQIADRMGEPTTVIINSLILMAVGLGMYLFRPGLRKIE
jgi:predicted MFS family arabinose efflux permease